jgi:hypothetical protein
VAKDAPREESPAERDDRLAREQTERLKSYEKYRHGPTAGQDPAPPRDK